MLNIALESSSAIIPLVLREYECLKANKHKLCGIAFNVIFKYQGLEDPSEAELAYQRRHYSCFGMQKKFSFNVQDKTSAELDATLEPMLLSKIGGVLHKVRSTTSQAMLDFHLTLVSKNEQGALTTLKRNYGTDELPLNLVQRMISSQEALVDPSLVEAMPAVDLPLGIKFHDSVIQKSNLTLETCTEDHIGYMRAHMIVEFLKLKGSPLTPKEYVMACDLATDISWRPSNGICAGVSDLFNAHILSRFLSEGALPDSSALFEQFMGSADFHKSLIGQYLPYYRLQDIVSFNEGSFSLNRSSPRVAFSTWAKIQEYFSEEYPHLIMFSAKADERLGLQRELDRIDQDIHEASLKLGFKGSAHVPDSLEAFLRQQIRLIEGGKGSVFISFQAMQSLLQLSAMVQQRLGIHRSVKAFPSLKLSEILTEIEMFSAANTTFCVKVSYQSPAASSGHVVSLFISRDLNRYMFFDSNLGLIEFASNDDLLSYCSQTLNSFHDFEIVFMRTK
jgi:hypothetical protein